MDELRCGILLSILFCQFCLAGETSLMSVEGLFYLDGNPVRILIQDSVIVDIQRFKPSEDKDLPQFYIAPGFIDNQVNGFMAVGFTDSNLTVDKIRLATDALRRTGVTTYFPTIISCDQQRLMTNVGIMAQAMQDADIGASIPGIHLEGPYISPEEGYRGAHELKYIRPPDWNEFMQVYETAQRKIYQLTIAPELDGAFDFIRRCQKMGIVVGLGHHKASAEIIVQAVDLGADISVHLGNGCANLIHRHDNPLWPQLADDRLIASIIVDGFHLRPEEVQVFFKIKGPERLILTSDVTQLAGMPPGEYIWNERTVLMTPEGMITYPEQNVLAGASLPVSAGIGNIMRFTGCSLADAIHMVSRNPARLYGLTDRGEIHIGKRADLLLFSLINGVLNVRKTILSGRIVYDTGK